MARQLSEAEVLAARDALAVYEATGARVKRIAAEAVTRPRLQDASQVMASLIPPKRASRTGNGPDPERRAAVFGSDVSALDKPQPMVKIINMALTDQIGRAHV